MTVDTRSDTPALAGLRREAEGGSPDALYRLGAALVAAGKAEEAAVAYRQAARSGHADARIEWARMLLYGVGAAPDPAEAVHWLEQAEAAGRPGAGYLLALVAVGGTALPFDERINARMHAAIRHELPPALRAAAIHFGRRPDPDDQTRCLQLLDRAARRGDVVAAQLLAERLVRGEGCDAQPQAAELLWQQLARHGVPRLPAIEVQAAADADADAAGMPAGALDFAEALRVPASTTLSGRPSVRQIDPLLSADECRLLAAAALPHLQPSMTVDPATGAPMANPIRTSHDASFDPLLEDFALRLVQQRMARAAGLPLVQAERLIVLRYTPGQEYRPHRDYLPPGRLAGDRPEAGNRRRTICVYLNAVGAGGETEFPQAGLKVAPAAGRALVFDNLDADGQPDTASLHAGCPVLEGEKWLATLWIRERQYRRF